MLDAHDTIEAELDDLWPAEGLEREDGVMVGSCAMTLRIVHALQEAGHLPKEDAVEHRWVALYIERPGEVSLECACGMVWKHLPLMMRARFDLPQCPNQEETDA